MNTTTNDDRDRTDMGLPERHECDGGWIDRDRARPCLICRPWLRRTGNAPRPPGTTATPRNPTMSTDHERDDARRRALHAGVNGCPDCNSHDVITEDPNDSGIFDVWIRHEESCPTLAILRAHGLAK